MRQIVLDTETTGLRFEDKHRIIEIGCIELIDRKITERNFHVYLNPQREVDLGAVSIHGLTNEFLRDKPLFKDIVAEFMAFIADAEVIIHNAPFDVGFLNYELHLLQGQWQQLTTYCRVIDTLVMARNLHAGQRNTLDALCKRYAIDNSCRELHGALLDANLLAQIYLAMTGGQSNFFDMLGQKGQAKHVISATTHAYTHRKLEISGLSVSNLAAEEASLHDEYLQTMTAQGKCLWSELTD